MNVHINLRTPEELVKQIDWVMEKKKHRNRSEAINAALKEYVRQCRLLDAEEKIHEIARTAPKTKKSLSKIIEEMHEEE